MLPVDPDDLLARCREAGEIEPVAIALGVDSPGASTRRSEQLGAPWPYQSTLPPGTKATLSAFLTRKDRIIRESVRATFRLSYEAGADLRLYVAARTPAAAVP
ncbi:MAG: hypothetical protein R3D70_25060 [Rhizobiaceae bacterium]